MPMNTSNHDDPEAILAAKGLIHRFPEKVIEELLDKCDTQKMLRRLCMSSDGVNYHQLIGAMDARDPDADADASSNRSRRLTNESQDSRSMRPSQIFLPSDNHGTAKDGSSSSPQPESSSSTSLRRTGSSLLRINVLQDEKEKDQKLNGKYSQHSNFLIRSEVVDERLEEAPKLLKTPITTNYRDKHIRSDQVVRLTWEMGGEAKTHYNTFLVVSSSSIPDADIIIGESEPDKQLLQASTGSCPRFKLKRSA
jgi:hypothetical protein